MSSMYCIPNVLPRDENRIFAQIIEFAWDSELIRAAHLGKDLIVEVEGSLGPRIHLLAEKLKKCIRATAQFDLVFWPLVYENTSERD